MEYYKVIYEYRGITRKLYFKNDLAEKFLAIKINSAIEINHGCEKKDYKLIQYLKISEKDYQFGIDPKNQEIEKINTTIKEYSNNLNCITLKDLCVIDAKIEILQLDDTYKLEQVKFLIINQKDKTEHGETLKLYIEKTYTDSYYIFGDNKVIPFNQQFKDIEKNCDIKEVKSYITSSLMNKLLNRRKA